MSTPPFLFPPASQAQIIRANQRDLFHVASLREQMETTLQTWLGTRWLHRWDKEIQLCASLAYYFLTTASASQTLGEEYTDIWPQLSRSNRFPSRMARSLLILSSTLPPYLISRMMPRLSSAFPNLPITTLLHRLPQTLEVLSEINLAVFYFFGTYYDLAKRAIRIRHISSSPQNPNIRPPSYSLLGIMISIRLMYRLIVSLRSLSSVSAADTAKTGQKQSDRGPSTEEPAIDSRPVYMILAETSTEEKDTTSPEDDEHTFMDMSSLSANERAGRRCTLCLEERTSSCATECGHLFCWSCIVEWGREKAECPLCRQSINLTRLLPIYNL